MISSSFSNFRNLRNAIAPKVSDYSNPKVKKSHSQCPLSKRRLHSLQCHDDATSRTDSKCMEWSLWH